MADCVHNGWKKKEKAEICAFQTTSVVPNVRVQPVVPVLLLCMVTHSPLSHKVAARAWKANPVCCVPHSAVLDGWEWCPR